MTWALGGTLPVDPFAVEMLELLNLVQVALLVLLLHLVRRNGS
jgi:hypothetical protein